MYAFTVELTLDCGQSIAALTEILQAHKLGIVSEIDVQAVMKKKLDEDIPAYRILGACNPMLAKRVLAAEPNAGTLLPCNIVVRDAGEKTVIAFMEPQAVLGLSDNPELKAVADEARSILLQVKAALEKL